MNPRSSQTYTSGRQRRRAPSEVQESTLNSIHRVVRNDMHTHVWLNPSHPELAVPDAGGQVESLLADMDGAGVNRAAIITPRSMGWNDEYTLSAARAYPDRLVAVVRCDMNTPLAATQLSRKISRGASGVRIAADDGPLHRLLDDDSRRLRELLLDTRLPLALHAYPEDLSTVDSILHKLPGLTVVLDHFGRPSVGLGVADPTFQRVLEMAKHPGLVLKTPDVPFFTPKSGTTDDLIPFFTAALETFGPERVAWGSDWPLCGTGKHYGDVTAPISMALIPYSLSERDLVWHGNFDRIYG